VTDPETTGDAEIAATPETTDDAATDATGAGREGPPTPHTERPARFMVIVAHPDDADFGPAATAAAWIAAGSVGQLVCLTSGEAGGEDPDADPLALARTREEEQRRAAAIVGYEAVHFLHQPDGALANDLNVRKMLVQVIREFRPDAVLCQDPTTVFHDSRFVNHTDHRAAGMAAVDAVYPAARNPMAFPELARGGLEKHVVPRIYLFATNEPNAWVDTTATFDTKLAALREHPSQIAETDEAFEWIRTWAKRNGERVGVEMADAFRIIEVDA
jgi:LmbE family N-acetylglucosaminyl deacetylase